MGSRLYEFTQNTKEQALARQHNLCGCCGEKISALGDAGRADHRFGEGAQAHHIKHHKHGGDDSESNCVILCWTCHYSVHEGGRYRTGSVDGKPSDYLHYYGA